MKIYKLRFKGRKTWHNVKAKTLDAAKRKFIKGSTYRLEEVFVKKR